MKKIIKLSLITILFFLFQNKVYAASNYTISLSSSTPAPSKNVTLYIKGNNIQGGFSISSSDSTVCSVSSQTAWVENNTQTITISTQKVGVCTIKVSPISISDDNGKDLNLAAKTLTLNVGNSSNNKQNSQTTPKSSDANLKSLSIEGVEITPSFKSDIQKYEAQLEAGTTKIKINATTNDSKATINGIGERSVNAGTNKIEIVVTAEDKSTKTYTINVNVKDYDPINIKIDNKNYSVIRNEKELPEVDLFEKSKVKIGEEEVIGYYNDKLNIYLIGLKDEEGTTALYIYDTNKEKYTKFKWITVGGVTLYLKDTTKKLPNFKKYNITIKNTDTQIYKINKKDKVGLLYGINIMTGNKDYYIYDKEEETLARYYNQEVNLYKNKLEKYSNYTMILTGTVSIIIIISLIISLLKNRKRRRLRHN